MFPKFYEEKSGKKRFLRVSCSDGSQPKVRALEACWGKIEEKEEKGIMREWIMLFFYFPFPAFKYWGGFSFHFFFFGKGKTRHWAASNKQRGALPAIGSKVFGQKVRETVDGAAATHCSLSASCLSTLLCPHSNYYFKYNIYIFSSVQTGQCLYLCF